MMFFKKESTRLRRRKKRMRCPKQKKMEWNSKFLWYYTKSGDANRYEGKMELRIEKKARWLRRLDVIELALA